MLGGKKCDVRFDVFWLICFAVLLGVSDSVFNLLQLLSYGKVA